MSTTRRDFIKTSSLFMGGMTVLNAMPSSIQRALSIEAEPGTTFLDAEHIVFLMQENRSFDHCYGTLSGVRGFNDPRVIHQPNQLPVWFQTDQDQSIYGPFRLDIENTKITWMGSLPHSWKDMVEARNEGKMDQWLIAKKPGNKEYAHMPLTMGYFTREDIPFYYAFADAFTVCDQHFCSSLTGTSANRSYFWAGAIRENPRDPNSVAHVNNGQINYKDVSWKTYPERLEENNISWRVYQNELSLPVGFTDMEESWLANFTDNNLEFYKQYNVRFHKAHIQFKALELKRLNQKIEEGILTGEALQKAQAERLLLEEYLVQYGAESFAKLSDFEQRIHHKAFATNIADPDYHRLEEIEYQENGEIKKVEVPKGDILYQFRKDVSEDKLPLVSWLVAPCNFSDHPGAPWFGAWYVSEVLDILTKNPEVWKKTIFILTYDENDGYFDHVAPFVPPLSTDSKQGKVSSSMDTQDEWVTLAQDKARDSKSALSSPIGLGYRVPMVVASPWTRGGWVNSEVCDLTSTLQFLEYFIEKKTGKKVIEENISQWRRGTCSNMTSVFQPANDLKKVELDFVDRNSYVERILNARDKNLPHGFNAYTKQELEQHKAWNEFKNFPKQESGVKKACGLPYNINVNAFVDSKGMQMNLDIQANQLKNKAYLAPIQVYAHSKFQRKNGRNWNFSVDEKEPLSYAWASEDLEQGYYNFSVHSFNGFYRNFKGKVQDPTVAIDFTVHANQTVSVVLKNKSNTALTFYVQDVVYSKENQKITVKPNAAYSLKLDYAKFKGWYDVVITLADYSSFVYQYAGHIENGKSSITDPYMASFSKWS
ncbi:phospholipase C, phosphocholine-specific [Myroides sp. 1354]|uniref:phosphocholine-specific phospholipase C n=1 Tax=unclassified Myroides TaxID=2642485 RepID=UPI0025779B2A|nr:MULTISPECIES: phospholipase C, phosphocholine-specific [unclassified Myroides]MDM1045786.1 phospholipase C, phosphocholine-specific [Myroides sp. R163-1]MDM1055759.1 phospholipase C, phosphocholine-specific [Myroides sp. 1354]MDM1069851.1 phospholipase C, phosphocholine-specific [Myroides sp. 1372]